MTTLPSWLDRPPARKANTTGATASPATRPTPRAASPAAANPAANPAAALAALALVLVLAGLVVAPARAQADPFAVSCDQTLAAAAQNGNLDAVRCHLLNGADINQNDGEALNFAVFGASASVVLFLLEAGANVNQPYTDQRNALERTSPGTPDGDAKISVIISHGGYYSHVEFDNVNFNDEFVLDACPAEQVANPTFNLPNGGDPCAACDPGRRPVDGFCRPDDGSILTCPNGEPEEQRTHGFCPTCALGETRVNRACVAACPDGQERFNGLCVAECPPGYDRLGQTAFCGKTCADDTVARLEQAAFCAEDLALYAEIQKPAPDLAVIREKINQGAFLDLTQNGAPLLIAAATLGHALAVSVLVTAGADPNARGAMKKNLPHFMTDDPALPLTTVLRVLAHFADALPLAPPEAPDFAWNTVHDGPDEDLRAIELLLETQRKRDFVGFDFSTPFHEFRRIGRLLLAQGETCNFSRFPPIPGDFDRDGQSFCNPFLFSLAECPDGDDSWTCRECAGSPVLDVTGDACAPACNDDETTARNGPAAGDARCVCTDGMPPGVFGCRRITQEDACTTPDPTLNPIGGILRDFLPDDDPQGIRKARLCELPMERFLAGNTVECENFAVRSADSAVLDCSRIYQVLRGLMCHEQGLVYKRSNDLEIIVEPDCFCPDTGVAGPCYGEPETPSPPAAVLAADNNASLAWSAPELNRSTLYGYDIFRRAGAGADFVSVAFAPAAAGGGGVVPSAATLGGLELRFKIRTRTEWGPGTLSAESNPIRPRACDADEIYFIQPAGGYVCVHSSAQPGAQRCLDAGWTVLRDGRGEAGPRGRVGCGIPLRDAAADENLERCFLWSDDSSAAPLCSDAFGAGLNFPSRPALAARYVFGCPGGFSPDAGYVSGDGAGRQQCVGAPSAMLVSVLAEEGSGARLATLEIFLAAGASPNATDADGVSALMLAGLAGHAGAVSLLIARGADPDGRHFGHADSNLRTLPHLLALNLGLAGYFPLQWSSARDVLRSFAFATDARNAAEGADLFDWNAPSADAGAPPPLESLKTAYDIPGNAFARETILGMAAIMRTRGGRCARLEDLHAVCTGVAIRGAETPENLMLAELARVRPRAATVAALALRVQSVNGTDADGASYLLLAALAGHADAAATLVAAGANPDATHPLRSGGNAAHLQTRNRGPRLAWERRLAVLRAFAAALDARGASFGGWGGLDEDPSLGGDGAAPRDYLAAHYAGAATTAEGHALLRMAALIHGRGGMCARPGTRSSAVCASPDALLLAQIHSPAPDLALLAVHAESVNLGGLIGGYSLPAVAATVGNAGAVSVLVAAGSPAAARTPAPESRNVAHLAAANAAADWEKSRDVLLAFGAAVGATGEPFEWGATDGGGANPLDLLAMAYASASPDDQAAIQEMANFLNRRGVACGAGAHAASPACSVSDAPDAPGSFAAALVGDAATEVSLSWAAPAENGSAITAYYVWRSDAADFPTGGAGENSCPSTGYAYASDSPRLRLAPSARGAAEDLGAAAYGLCYEYAVAALNDDGAGPRARVRTVPHAAPATVATPRAAVNFSGFPRVSWTALTDRETEIRGPVIKFYQVEREDNAGADGGAFGRRTVAAPAAMETAFSDSSATLEYAYRYRVRAVGLSDKAGEWSGWSETAVPQLGGGCPPGQRSDGRPAPMGCQTVGALCSDAAVNRRWLPDLRAGREGQVRCRCGSAAADEPDEAALDGSGNYCAPRGLAEPLPGVNENPQYPLTVFAACQSAGYARQAHDFYLTDKPRRDDNPSRAVEDSRYLHCDIHTEELIGGASQGVRDRCVVALQTHQRELIAKRNDGGFNLLHPEARTLVTLRFCHELFDGLRGGPTLSGGFPAESPGLPHAAHNPYRHGGCGPGEALSRAENRCVRDCDAGIYTDLGQGQVSGLTLTAGSDVASDSCACPAGMLLDGDECAPACGPGRTAAADLASAAGQEWTAAASCVDEPNVSNWREQCGAAATQGGPELIFRGGYRTNNLAVLCPMNRDVYHRVREILYSSRACWLSAEPDFHLTNPPPSEPSHIPPCDEVTEGSAFPENFRRATHLLEFGRCVDPGAGSALRATQTRDDGCVCADARDLKLGDYCVPKSGPVPDEPVVCTGAFGGEGQIARDTDGSDRTICSDIDWNDTFCIVGAPEALPCQGFFDHVRNCNILARPALDPWHCGPRCGLGHAAGARCVFGPREFLENQNGGLTLHTARLTVAADYPLNDALHRVELLQTEITPVFSIFSGLFGVGSGGAVRRSAANAGQSGEAVVQVTHPRNTRAYFRLTVEVQWVFSPAYSPLRWHIDRPNAEEVYHLINQQLSGFMDPGMLMSGAYRFMGLYQNNRPRPYPDDFISVAGQVLTVNRPDFITRPGNYIMRVEFTHPDMLGALLLNVPMQVYQ